MHTESYRIDQVTTADSVDRWVANLAGRRILVVGDLILDQYWSGHAKRLSPEAPIPVVDVTEHTWGLGGAANVAASIAALGGRPAVVGIVGDDAEGARLVQELKSIGLDSDGVVVADHRPTTSKLRVISHNQQVVRIDRECRSPLPPSLEDELLAIIEAKRDDADAIVLSNYAKGVVSSRLARRVLTIGNEQETPVIVDPHGPDYTVYRGATLIKPNHRDAEVLLRLENCTLQDMIQAGQQLSHQLPGSHVLFSCGALGMVLFRDGQSPQRFPADASHVCDVAGAGDTVIAVMALAISGHMDLEMAVWVANHAAGIVVGKHGVSVVSTAELRRSIQTKLRTLPSSLHG